MHIVSVVMIYNTIYHHSLSDRISAVHPDLATGYIHHIGSYNAPGLRPREFPHNSRGVLRMDLEDVDTENSVCMTWSIDPSGTMRHRKTGTKVSTKEGITCPGGQVGWKHLTPWCQVGGRCTLHPGEPRNRKEAKSGKLKNRRVPFWMKRERSEKRNEPGLRESKKCGCFTNSKVYPDGFGCRW